MFCNYYNLCFGSTVRLHKWIIQPLPYYLLLNNFLKINQSTWAFFKVSRLEEVGVSILKITWRPTDQYSIFLVFKVSTNGAITPNSFHIYFFNLQCWIYEKKAKQFFRQNKIHKQTHTHMHMYKHIHIQWRERRKVLCFTIWAAQKCSRRIGTKTIWIEADQEKKSLLFFVSGRGWETYSKKTLVLFADQGRVRGRGTVCVCAYVCELVVCVCKIFFVVCTTMLLVFRCLMRMLCA